MTNYQNLNRIAIKEDLMGAYQALLDGLKKIKGKEGTYVKLLVAHYDEFHQNYCYK